MTSLDCWIRTFLGIKNAKYRIQTDDATSPAVYLRSAFWPQVLALETASLVPLVTSDSRCDFIPSRVTPYRARAGINDAGNRDNKECPGIAWRLRLHRRTRPPPEHQAVSGSWFLFYKRPHWEDPYPAFMHKRIGTASDLQQACGRLGSNPRRFSMLQPNYWLYVTVSASQNQLDRRRTTRPTDRSGRSPSLKTRCQGNDRDSDCAPLRCFR